MKEDLIRIILNSPVVVGLEAQGHIPTIEKMLKEGKNWEEIGRAIHWEPRTAEKHYGWYKDKLLKHFFK